MSRGLLIAFEGIDRSGKSSTIDRLSSKLDKLGIPWSLFRFPARQTPTGELLDKHLKGVQTIEDHRATHLVFTANRWEAQ